MSFIEDTATETIDGSVEKVKAKPAFLQAIMRIAGDRLAEIVGHDFASRAHATLARRHAEKDVRWKR